MLWDFLSNYKTNVIYINNYWPERQTIVRVIFPLNKILR